MKILSWNCRGLGNPWTVQDLHHLVKEKRPDIVFLIETKLMAKNFEGIKRRMAWDGCFVVEAIGRSGGLVLLWKDEEEVDIVNFSQHHISAYVGKDERWLLTGLYGHPEVNRRRDSWKLLSLIKPSGQVPWCTIEDFNKVCYQDEKEWGRPRPESQMREFRHALEENCLFDLRWKGCKFTWSNRHEDQTFTKERLDRAVANCWWKDLFKNREVEVLTVRQSDHKALLMSMDKDEGMNKKRRRIFRFEAKWTLEEDGGAIIEDVWKRRVSLQNLMGQVQQKLSRCQRELLHWSFQRRQNAEILIKEKTERLKEEQENEGPHNARIIKSLQRDLGLLLAQEDLKWKQRAKWNWYKNGDKNTKFFHSCASQKRIKNRIKEIRDDNGRVVTEQGPDGYGACFFQAYWGVVGEEVCKAVLGFLNGQEGKLITDNVMIAYEALHTMKTRQKGKVGSMALKLDMAKAYYRIEWSFLENIMRKMGFGERWIGLVMQCVSSVTYSVMVNEQSGRVIKPTRGIRQGDPISPYLFILCAEGLSNLINKAETRCEIQGVAIAKGGTRVSHLLFADDCVIFGRAKRDEWYKIHGLLDTYGKASGQQLNLQKTTIFFSSNTAESMRQDVQRAARVPVCGSYEKYLDLPAMVGRSKYNSFRIIKERVWAKLHNWKNLFLTQAGKEFLLKAVVQAIPTFTMSVSSFQEEFTKRCLP
ncbi:uncharacterized protein LOC122310310 [Carya illinoinensis]|uniref:uncharacterized protein LOC122310310 n=1 Tax=Carya illinoinensis TaxID=32201 RepID=UPI001C724A70|nr:uncharacterized protein LOC122310310 [Carya illinoinensis]